jgi:GxGYxYP putative glycoside hydrolase C-terminal domain/GxGYxY sequence motif in domain of unknown function N-terminal
MKWCLLLALGVVSAMCASAEERWWPTQRLPGVLLRTTDQQTSADPRLPLQMLVQSAAGLAAKSVNDGTSGELVWCDGGVGENDEWFKRLRARHPALEISAPLAPWALVDRLSARGIIKGYVLYRTDHSAGETNTYRSGIDCSVNVATSLAGLLNGVIVDESLETTAQAHGLKRLFDARDKTQAWCFATYRDRFKRRILCTQDPRKPNVRDLAIAQRAFTTFGPPEAMGAAMKWLEPLSPILGWNCGDEFAVTDLSSRYGHIQTSTDWCMNLPVLMAASETLAPPKAPDLDPATIDWNDARDGITFVNTDGDNVQWLQGNFFTGDEGRFYWGSPSRGKIPFGWSTCFAHLAQLCPESLDYAMATRSPRDSFIEWGGGYYYPDRFGLARAERWGLLAQHARRTWALMQATNTRLIGFNCAKIDSPGTRKACEVFAGQTDGLLAIFVFQYSRYEEGAGQIFWVKDRGGNAVPVISARYTIWENANDRARAGTPAKVAREIRETGERAPRADSPRYDWVIDHVWSTFRRAPGSDENAENLSASKPAPGVGARGYEPVTWCAERLPNTVRVMSPEELAWRIRMKHDPAQTRALFSRFRQTPE